MQKIETAVLRYVRFDPINGVVRCEMQVRYKDKPGMYDYYVTLRKESCQIRGCVTMWENNDTKIISKEFRYDHHFIL